MIAVQFCETLHQLTDLKYLYRDVDTLQQLNDMLSSSLSILRRTILSDDELQLQALCKCQYVLMSDRSHWALSFFPYAKENWRIDSGSRLSAKIPNPLRHQSPRQWTNVKKLLSRLTVITRKPQVTTTLCQ